MRSLLVLLVVAVSSAGCAAPAPTEAMTFSDEFVVEHGEQVRHTERFELAKPERVGYMFRVEDGGRAAACFVRDGDVEAWFAGARGRSAPDEWDAPGPGLCSPKGTAGEVRGEMPAGRWTLALWAGHCPALDCSVHLGREGFRPAETTTLSSPDP